MIRDAQLLLERCLPRNSVKVHKANDAEMFVLSAYSRHLACLFPQHGPGLKWKRRIELERWQDDLLREAPLAFLRGCINSDGCVFINRTGKYEYLSYGFSNVSKDIAFLFTRACELAGIRNRRNCFRGTWQVRINRRESVAILLEHVPAKA